MNNRSEERDREYGGFTKGMIKTAKIATELCNKVITPEDAFKILMALKLSRLAHSIKMDSLTDLIGYAEGLWDYANRDVISAIREQLDLYELEEKTVLDGIHLKKGDKVFVKKNEIEECDLCDGCGWFEGGSFLKNHCEQCKGTGVVIKKK